MKAARPIVLAGPAARHVAPALAKLLGAGLYLSRAGHFPDRTTDIDVDAGRCEFARRQVVVVQGLHDHPQERLVEFLLLTRLAADLGAERIVGCVPYVPYGRGDWRDRPGRPLVAKVFADLLRACDLDALVTLDAHSPQLEGFFDFPFVSIGQYEIFSQWLERLESTPHRPSIVVAPDAGGYKRAQAVASRLDLDVAVLAKQRGARGAVQRGAVQFRDTLSSRRVLLVDDALISGRTIASAADQLIRGGAEDVLAAVTHCPPLDVPVSSLGLAAMVTSDSMTPSRTDGVLTVSATPALARAVGDLLGIQDRNARLRNTRLRIGEDSWVLKPFRNTTRRSRRSSSYR